MLEILFKDEHICIINKVSGHVVHRTRGGEAYPFVLQLLRDQLDQYVYPVHRLDRGTSGCLAFALSSEDASKLQTEIQSDSSIKKYTALCRGKLKSKEGIFDRELNNENKIKQKAVTKYRLIKEYKDVSLIELEILTGRRHQIRRHLAFEAHQIVGDVSRGKGWLNRRFRENYDFHRMFLHCHYFSFLHPISGERLNIHCELPDELNSLLNLLDKETLDSL